jgi:hypothetical protein
MMSQKTIDSQLKFRYTIFMIEILKQTYGAKALKDLQKAAMSSHPELKSQKKYEEWLTDYHLSFFSDLCDDYEVELD